MPHRRRHYLIKRGFQLKYTLAIVGVILTVMLVSGVGLYVGMWSSIIENFSKFKVSENLETARRIAGYEEARYSKGDFRLEKIFREAELLSAQEQDTLHRALNSVNRSLVPKIAILAVIIFIGGIFISHRIAGPIYRFQKSAEAIRNGDLSVNFNIRKTDELKDTAASLEDMVESLRKDIGEVKKLNHDPQIDKILSKYKV
ncbi:MAG: methyl-accepting chemotaxis protein [Candidatus Omnitrophota bacterium]|nr:methyl-accepting chemotaxis protein [Candidatus Omnitrophota bacterium]